MFTKTFAEYKSEAARYITVFESPFFPDYLDVANTIYRSVLKRFDELLHEADSSQNLLLRIGREPNPSRTQQMRVFRKYVSPDTSVEMLKNVKKLPTVIENFGERFRKIDDVRDVFEKRPPADETLMALLYEYSLRGQKGYQLTEAFFLWFEERFRGEYIISGPARAGKDVSLDTVLPNYHSKTPADIYIQRKDGTPILVGFARYDSDRGGAQEDDRTGGNQDKVTTLLAYSAKERLPLRIFFLNDGPGLLLGSMWNDYAYLENLDDRVLVSTLKMLDTRFTKVWLES